MSEEPEAEGEASALQADYINPFVDATCNCFDVMLGVRVRLDHLHLKGDEPDIVGVSGIIGLGGQASGVVTLNFSQSVAIKAVEAFVQEEYGEICPEIIDGVSELTNIIAGNAKKRLSVRGYKFDIGLPRVIKGERYEVESQRSKIPTIIIRFNSPLGPLSLEVSLVKAAESSVEASESAVDTVDVEHLEVLDKTLKGSIALLTDLTSLTNLESGSRLARVQRMVRTITEMLDLRDCWRFESAALLSDIGKMVLPTDITAASEKGQHLSRRDQELFKRHPAIGAKLLRNIPGLEDVAWVVERQLFDFSAYPKEETYGDLALGAQSLRLARDLDGLIQQGMSQSAAIMTMRNYRGTYNPDILDLAQTIQLQILHRRRQHVDIRHIHTGMILDEDLVGSNGSVLVPKGQELSGALLQRLHIMIARGGLEGEIWVLEA